MGSAFFLLPKGLLDVENLLATVAATGLTHVMVQLHFTAIGADLNGSFELQRIV
jgi:hypothetical protein